MENTVPDYIFMSGLSAQQARSKRMSSRPTSPRSPVAQTAELMPQLDSIHTDSEIKSVVGYLPAAYRAWPVQMQFDMPRLVQL
ncbi:hypothetical protein J3B02_005583 [Coemansia erecta]|nr:hypothetical protein J3B02_005583 [Coemansia erecta]